MNLKEQIKDAQEKIVNTPVSKFYRKAFLAWLGANKAAFDYAKDNVEKLNERSTLLIEDLVVKGEDFEKEASKTIESNIEKARHEIEPRFNEVKTQFDELLGRKVANDVKKPAKKKATSKKTAAKKTAAKKTVAKKTTAKKAVAKKTTAKKTAVKKPVVKTEAPKATETKAA